MKKGIKYFIGIVTIALGIAMTIQANMGAGTWDLLAHGLSLKFSMTTGFWQNINFITSLVLITIIFKRKLNVLSLIPGLVLGSFVDVFLRFDFAAYLHSYLLIFLGTFVMAVGVMIYLRQNLMPNAIDYLMLTLQEELKISTSLAKLITDGIPLIVAMVFGIYPYLGTLINFIFMPIFLRLITAVTGLGLEA